MSLILQKLSNLKLLSILNGTCGTLCLTFQIVLITFDADIFIASIGAGFWAALIFAGTAAAVLILNQKGGSGWLFGLSLILAGISAITGLQLLVLNISRFINNRGLVKLCWYYYPIDEPPKCHALPAGVITSYVFLAILGAVEAPLNVLTCLILIKTYVASLDFTRQLASSSSPA